MAELLLYVDRQPGGQNDPTLYQDGDVLCAFNRRRIRCEHAQRICHHTVEGFDSNGLRPTGLGHLFWHWQEAIYQYRFERVSRDEIKRVTLATGDEEILGATPNAAGERIDVPEFVRRRRAHPQHRLFGTPGREVWYGGRIDLSHPVLDSVWLAIETHSAEREANHPHWPLSAREKQVFYAKPIADISDDRVALLQAHEIDLVTRALVKKRTHRVDWRSLDSPRRRRDVLDESVEVDVRDTDTALDDAAIVVTR